MSNLKKCFTRPLPIIAFTLLLAATFILIPQSADSAQQKDKKGTPVAPPTLNRTTSRHEVRRFNYGSSLTIIGAPAGSITIESWPKSEVDITAEIELLAYTEEELDLLAVVNTFKVDDDINHLRILTTGTHDKTYMKKVAKKFPKTLMNLPWKIDYHVRVPANCDLSIDAGRGAISLSGVEGSISLKALESDVTLVLTGGTLMATIGAGSVKVSMPSRSWRGAGAIIQLALGDLTLELPAGFNADINADILRSGQIENSYETLVPLERTTFTTRSIRGRAGAGGATLALKVTEGTIRIKTQ